MSVDHTEDEYHLTPHGWVHGTYKFYGHADKIIDPPEDRVETWVRDMKQSHPFAKELITWECIWKSPDYSDDDKKKLWARYPRPS